MDDDERIVKRPRCFLCPQCGHEVKLFVDFPVLGIQAKCKYCKDVLLFGLSTRNNY